MIEARLDFLRSAQNADGGWGFFPRKLSWVEPTCYSLLAMHGAPGCEVNAERGWKLLRSLQLPDGSWPPCAAVAEPHWTTSLAVTLHVLRAVTDEPFRKGVASLLRTAGIENGWQFRIAHFLRPSVVELDPSFEAWPWRPGNSSWIEPTAHALVALKHAATVFDDQRLHERVAQGERMILDRRCSDGGWNYGNRKVLGADLPSYPETTALALIGLASRKDLAAPLALAARYAKDTRSPLAKAWLRVALRSHSVPPVDVSDGPPLEPNDVIVNALEVIAATGAIA
jgi:hypothetical protein